MVSFELDNIEKKSNSCKKMNLRKIRFEFSPLKKSFERFGSLIKIRLWKINIIFCCSSVFIWRTEWWKSVDFSATILEINPNVKRKPLKFLTVNYMIHSLDICFYHFDTEFLYIIKPFSTSSVTARRNKTERAERKRQRKNKTWSILMNLYKTYSYKEKSENHISLHCQKP